MWNEELHDNEVADTATTSYDEDIGDELSMGIEDFDDDMDVEPSTEDLE